MRMGADRNGALARVALGLDEPLALVPETFDPDHVLGQVDVLDLEGFEFARPQAGEPAARARSARDLAEEEEPRPWPGSYP
jgi:hypothetical protein